MPRNWLLVAGMIEPMALVTVMDSVPLPAMVPATCVPWPSVSARLESIADHAVDQVRMRRVHARIVQHRPHTFVPAQVQIIVSVVTLSVGTPMRARLKSFAGDRLRGFRGSQCPADRPAPPRCRPRAGRQHRPERRAIFRHHLRAKLLQRLHSGFTRVREGDHGSTARPGGSVWLIHHQSPAAPG